MSKHCVAHKLNRIKTYMLYVFIFPQPKIVMELKSNDYFRKKIIPGFENVHFSSLLVGIFSIRVSNTNLWMNLDNKILINIRYFVKGVIH